MKKDMKIKSNEMVIDPYKIIAGDIMRLYYGKGNVNNKRIHILYNFHDENQIAFKYWSRHKHRWIYKIEHYCFFETKYLIGVRLNKRKCKSAK